jgi:hypothetical protein
MVLRCGRVKTSPKTQTSLLELSTALASVFDDTARRCAVPLQERDLVSGAGGTSEGPERLHGRPADP